jgi:hypothetical protein
MLTTLSMGNALSFAVLALCATFRPRNRDSPWLMVLPRRRDPFGGGASSVSLKEFGLMQEFHRMR